MDVWRPWMQSDGWVVSTLLFNFSLKLREINIWLIFGITAVSLKAQISHSLLITDGVVINGNEPTLTFQAQNPQLGILSFNTNKVYTTQDGGENWSLKLVDPPQGFYGDPVLKTTKNGVVFLAHLAKNKQGIWPQFFDRIVFERSLDAGKSFVATDVGYREGKMQDKPWFTLDEWPLSKGQGNVYLSWTEFDKYGSANLQDSSRIWFACSRDGGISFMPPVCISDRSGNAMDNSGTAEGANVVASPDGVLHAVWARADSIWYDCSIDFGKTWGKDRCIAQQFGGWNHDNLKGLLRANGMPFIGADCFGNLAVVYSRNACENSKIFGCSNTDVFLVGKLHGDTLFGEAIKLNRVVEKKHFYGVVSKGLRIGKIEQNQAAPETFYSDQYAPMLIWNENHTHFFVTWYDRRRSETGYFFDVYGARFGFGKSRFFALLRLQKNQIFVDNNVRLSNSPSLAPGNSIFMGDYMGLDWKSNIHLAYTGYDVISKHPNIQLVKTQLVQKSRNGGRVLGVERINHPELVASVIANVVQKSSTLEESLEYKIEDRKILIWAAWPEANNFTIEFITGKQIVFEHVFENLDDHKVDFELPASRFAPGIYEIVLRKKGKMIKQPFYLN